MHKNTLLHFIARLYAVKQIIFVLSILVLKKKKLVAELTSLHLVQYDLLQVL